MGEAERQEDHNRAIEALADIAALLDGEGVLEDGDVVIAVHALRNERDRLWKVVKAAQAFAAAQTAWRERLDRGDPVRSTDPIAQDRAATIATLLDEVRHFEPIVGLDEAVDHE